MRDRARRAVGVLISRLSVGMVMLMPKCAWLRDEEALYAAHGQPRRRTSPLTTQMAMPRREEPAHVTAHNVHD